MLQYENTKNYGDRKRLFITGSLKNARTNMSRIVAAVKTIKPPKTQSLSVTTAIIPKTSVRKAHDIPTNDIMSTAFMSNRVWLKQM